MCLIFIHRPDTLTTGEADNMPEDQNIEWKESWRDEYLKWICGFANAQGGRIYIGMNDTGQVVGLTDYAKLMEDIPNKILQTLGIMADVNLLEKESLPYIEINVAPSSTPVNYKGEYHYRCGSTKQQLKGLALTDFLLRKTGSRWDASTINNLCVDDLENDSFKIFKREALRSKRLSEEDALLSNEELLKSMQLLNDGKLTRAAALLFYHNPEKVCPGCYVKIGKFEDGCELIYQDVINGSLFSIADKVLDVLYLKYLKASISYERDRRVERYPYLRSAVREIIFNALIHCNWSENIPIQIRVDEDALRIGNSCLLPLGWTQETLTQYHQSRPHNPLLANAFFRAGFVESWGRGIYKVMKDCRIHGYPEPQFDCIGHDICVTFRPADMQVSPKIATKSPITADSTKLSLEEKILQELRHNPALTIRDLSDALSANRGLIYRKIQNLITKNILIREGGNRKGKWVIAKELTVTKA